MNKFIITESEKKRILNLHKSRSFKHYLNESLVGLESTIGKEFAIDAFEVEAVNRGGDSWTIDDLKSQYADLTPIENLPESLSVKINSAKELDSEQAQFTGTLQGGGISQNINFRYKCGSNNHKIDITSEIKIPNAEGTWFEDKTIEEGLWESRSLDEYLDQNFCNSAVGS